MYTLVCESIILLSNRNVSDEDVQALERRLMQTMDMIVSKKKRIALAKKESLQRASVQQVRNAIHVFAFA